MAAASPIGSCRPAALASPPATTPARCRLEAAFEAEVKRLGGVQSARPKQLLDALRPQVGDGWQRNTALLPTCRVLPRPLGRFSHAY